MKNLDQLIDWQQEYENLRQEALQAGSRRGHGLALFLSRGMMAWLEALTAVLRPDLTTLLANMVLSCMRGETHEPIA